jgi:uncharacterized protein (TIGR00725 family)
MAITRKKSKKQQSEFEQSIQNIEPYCIKCKIGISGAAETGHCAIDAPQKAEALGREIAKSGMIAVTGATSGVPYWAAKGAKEAGGFVVGLSPAESEKEHKEKYHLPVDYHDLIIYTGFGFGGRNLFLTRSVDGLIVVCGRIGTLNEFSAAFEDNRPIGVLTETGGTADLIDEIVKTANRGPGRIVFDSDPKKLLEKLHAIIDQEDSSK